MRTLLSGCSFSDSSGWGDAGNHADPRCWYNILDKKYQLNIHNVAYGGHSNREIIHLAKQELLLDSYDLVIVQLTSTNRVWYWRESNPLLAAKINGGKVWNAETELEKQSLLTMALEFSNCINEVERDLTDLILLQQYLNKTPMILVNFENFGKLVLDMIKNCPTNNDELLPTNIYKNRLATLASKLDLTYATGFTTSFCSIMSDVADDNSHPGINSNKQFAHLVGNVIDKIL
jgi:hypothetical protein